MLRSLPRPMLRVALNMNLVEAECWEGQKKSNDLTQNVSVYATKEHTEQESTEGTGCPLDFFLFWILGFRGVRSFNSEDAGDQNETSDLPQLAHSLLQFQWVDLSSPALAHIHTLWCDCCSMSLYTDISSVSWWLMGRTFCHLIIKYAHR